MIENLIPDDDGEFTLEDAFAPLDAIRGTLANVWTPEASEYRGLMMRVIRRLYGFPEMLAARLRAMQSLTPGQRMLFLEILSRACTDFGLPDLTAIPEPSGNPVPRPTPNPPADVE